MAREAAVKKVEQATPGVVRRGPRKDYLIGLAGLRKALGLTQVELAERLGISQASVSQLESEARDGDPQLSSLERYAKALGGVVTVHVELGGRRYKVR